MERDTCHAISSHEYSEECYMRIKASMAAVFGVSVLAPTSKGRSAALAESVLARL
jgi:hypothetical protein